MARVLLILPSATYRAPDFIEAAQKLGAEVVVASDQRQALADEMGERALELPLDDVEDAVTRIVALAQRASLDAVMAVDDQGALVAAHASQRLGLAHNMPEAVATTRNKARMRKVLEHAKIPQPAFRVAPPGTDPWAEAGELGYPVVVKPVGLAASRGVIRADDEAGARDAVSRIRHILSCAGEDPDTTIIVERYVPGDEVAIEGLLRHNDLDVLAIFDKPDPLTGPYFEETIYVTPSRLPDATQQRIADLVARASAALRLRDGPIHAEVRIDGDDLYVLELAARTIGGLCSRTLRFGLGVSLEELVLRHALHRPIGRIVREAGASGVMMVPIPKAGTLEGVHGLDAAKDIPGVVGAEITIPRGSEVVPLPEGDRYLGFVFAKGDTPSEVEQALRDAHAALEIVIS